MKQQINRFLTVAGFSLFIGAVIYGSGGCGREKTKVETSQLQTALPEKVDFNFHIKPILSDRCFACHGPDVNKREAGLRLDTEEGAFAAYDSLGKYHAIVPKDLDDSQLFQRI